VTSQELDQRVLVLAPTGRDAALTCSFLEKAGLTARACSDIPAVCEALAGGAAVLMLAEEVLVPAAIQRLSSLLEEQEPWSDLPILLFSGEGATVQTRAPTLRMLEPLGNVVLLDRPVRPTTMLTAVRTALRARGRQYAAREALRTERVAVRERDKFLAMLGHELRNPLSPIFAALDLMERSEPVGTSSKYLAVIQRQATHLSRIVDDLLDVSRVTSGKIVLQRGPLELTELVRRCLQALGGAIATEKLTLAVTSESGPLVVDGDSVRLEQVVMNLTLNAIKYTQAGGHIQVSFAEEGGAAIVRFRDDGAGIPSETLPHVFDLFMQADQTLDRAKGGLGVGLTLVKSLVELHGGTVRASSDGPGMGSEFVVRLPLSVSDEAIAPPPAVTNGNKSLISGGPAGRHVLIIEDNEDSREMLQSLLEERGHHVDAAVDGPTGVARALELKPEVLLVDIGLPGMNGYGVAKRVREALGQSVFLIALTGYGQPEDRRLALEAGFDRHLTKPVMIEAVEGLLRQSNGYQGRALS
jgi:signal transduction histidine kinase/CheY-like chemotaxis protein